MTTSVHDSLDVQHDERGQRYVLRRSGDQVGVLEYHRHDDLVDIVHTNILPQVRGRGLGAVLVRDALEDLRTTDCRIRPTCWYVRDFIDENPEFAGMLEA